MRCITDINQIDFQELEQFVYNHHHGNFFQSTKAYEFFKSVENYEPILIVAKDGEEIVGSLLAVIIKEKGIKGFFSRRCIVWGGPLCSNAKYANYLINELNIFTKNKVIYIEFRNLFDVSDIDMVFKKNGYVFEDRINYILKIESVEENKKKLNKTRRWQISKGQKEGAIVVNATDLNEIKEFYMILKNLYQTKVRKPLPDFIFFEKFFQTPEIGQYFLVKYNDRIIAGTMCPVFRDTIYEWYECGLDKEYKNLYPGTLATWAPIEYGVKNGFKYFDFMGAGKPNEDYGVRVFKSEFGGKEVRYGRYIKVNNKMLYNAGKLGLKLMGGVKK